VENVLKRHVNLVALVVVLMAQAIGLAYQIRVKRGPDDVRLIRVWTVGVIAPIEKAVVHTGDFFGDIWHNYFYLRSVRLQNERLSDENTRLRLEQVRLAEDASQAQRLKALLKFKEQYVSATLPAEVIGGSGSELSRVIYIDKGSREGLKPDMAVINATGVVGKVIRVFPTTAQVLEINDQTSGIGAILETSRLQGILKGAPTGESQLNYVMADETVKPGERVLTSGGDHIFPKGLAIGTVTSVKSGEGLFLNIRVRPAANLNRLEEVLVVTKIDERDVEAPAEGPKRAADILAERLPSVPAKPPEQPGAAAKPGTTETAKPPATTRRPVVAHEPATAATPKPASTTPGTAKPGTIGTTNVVPAGSRRAAGANEAATGTTKPKTITDTPGAATKPKLPAGTTITTPAPAAPPKGSAAPAGQKPPASDNKPPSETTPQ
jgi:rod shape-determining protein MreC